MAYYTSGDPGGYYRPRFGGFSVFPPVIKGLILSNVIVWLLFDFLLRPFTFSGLPIFEILAGYLALWPIGTHFFPWQLLTYMFMHAGFLHIFFNMLALWMFGMELENVWGSKKFLIYYLMCGIGGGLSNLLVGLIVGQGAPTVGASGAVFGVLLAFGMLFPDRLIYIYFFLPIRAKYMVILWIGLELIYGVTGTTDGVAHFAHLGGAFVGFIFMAVDLNLIPIRGWFEGLSGRQQDVPTYMDTRRVRRTDTPVRDAEFFDIQTGRPTHRDRSGSREVTQEQIDAILDKISTGGYQSLTDEEKSILNEASKRIH
jgi:membrane associated rhomboid family serine protease